MARRIRQWIGYFIMVAGLGLLAGPFLAGARGEKIQEQVVETFYQETGNQEMVPTVSPAAEAEEEVLPQEPQEMQEPQEVQESQETQEPWESAEDPEFTDSSGGVDYREVQMQQKVQQSPGLMDSFYQAAKAYNDSLQDGGQDAMSGITDVEHFALNAQNYGLTENIIGVIEIPRMEIRMGLYLGANLQNMAKGAAIFGMTSLPLGGENENGAIAGHRGSGGTPVFRNIQKMQINDPIYITTPWKVLVYRVCEIRIVPPEDNNWCRIQPGRTLISLMTCHPYGQNSQRYIVTAELSWERKPSQEEIIQNNRESYDPAPKEVTMVNSDGTSETVIVDSTSITPDSREYGSVISNVVILAEDKMKIAAWAAAALVVLMGIWLTVATVQDFRKNKK